MLETWKRGKRGMWNRGGGRCGFSLVWLARGVASGTGQAGWSRTERFQVVGWSGASKRHQKLARLAG